MIYKIDIHESKEKLSYKTEILFTGSIIFESKKGKDWIFDFLIHDDNQMVIEGMEVISYELPNYILFVARDFAREGLFLRDLIYNCDDFNILNTPLEDINLVDGSDCEHLIIESSDFDSDSLFDSDIFKEFNSEAAIIKLEYSYEWGASAYWEKYIVSVAAGITVKIIDKLKNIGLPGEKIQRFQLPEKLKKVISKEYDINPTSLFLVQYSKDNMGIIFISLRNSSIQFDIKFEKNEIIELNTTSLNKFL